MRARAALYHHVQALFEQHLRGLYRLDQAVHYAPKPAEQKDGERRNAYGKQAEIVQLAFGGFELMLASPHEVPPLGRVTLSRDGELLTSGPLDEATFARVGRAIHHHQQEATPA